MAFEISVFLKNKITHFEEVTNALKKEDINISSMTLMNIYQGWGVVKLLVSQPEKAYQILSDRGDSVSLREIIALEMKDEAGGLNDLLLKVAQAKVNFNNANGRIIEATKSAILILDVPDIEESKKRLLDNDMQLLDDNTIYGN